MDELVVCRQEIDAIDAQLIALFEQRMQITARVADYKRAHSLPVLQSGREQQVVQQAVEALHDPRYAEQAAQLMRVIMALSRDAQHSRLAAPQDTAPNATPSALPDGVAAFQGVPGSFSEQALIELFGDTRATLPCAAFEDVFLAVRDGKAVCGVLPIENSSTGSISQVYDLLGQYEFHIVGEHRLRIRQNLVGLPGATLASVRTVYSHAQGFEQSAAFFAQHPDWETVHFHNTAISAQMVAQSGDPAKAAVASSRAAQLYGLSVLAPDIQDNPHNTTRFIVIARTPLTADANKLSIAFSIGHKSGSLYSVLRHFADGQFNMVKLESRPIPDVPWTYRFYLDFEGDPLTGNVKSLLETLAHETCDFRLLGAYRTPT